MTGAAPSVRALTCSQCGAPISLRAAGYSVSVVCGACGSTLDATAPDLALIAKADMAMRAPLIPLGSRGTLLGIEWEAIGYLRRSDPTVRWSEYLLFNPYYGYRFLVDDGRNWSIGVLLTYVPTRGFRGRKVDGRLYTVFGESYTAWATFVVGEFYWRVAVDETVRVRDFVRPGSMLSCEEGPDEQTWTRLDMFKRNVVEKAFGLEARRDWSDTPSPHEPSPYAAALKLTLPIVAVALAVLLLIVTTLTPRLVNLTAVAVPTVMDAPDRTVTVGPITLPNPHNRVVVSAQASGLDNSWIDLDLSLVDRKTQQSYDAYALTEAYHGRDSEGLWAEGETSRDVVISHAPAGQYDLVMDVGAHRWTGPGSSTAEPWFSAGADRPTLTVSVDRGGLSQGNFTLAFLAVAAWPCLIGFLEHRFQKRRRGAIA